MNLCEMIVRVVRMPKSGDEPDKLPFAHVRDSSTSLRGSWLHRMRPGFLPSGCTTCPGARDYSLNELSVSVAIMSRILTGDGFVSHNNLILGTINGLHMIQGMENGLEVLLIMQQVL